MKFGEFCEQLTDTVAPSIKEIACGNLTPTNILTLCKKVDAFLYRSFGDEDLIVNNNAQKQIKNLSVYFKGMIQTADYVIDNLKDENCNDKKILEFIKDYKINLGTDITEEDKKALLFAFMMEKFTNKIIQYCLQTYKNKINQEGSGIIAFNFPLEKKLVHDYIKTNDDTKIRVVLRKFLKKTLKDNEDFQELTSEEKKLNLEDMVDKALEEIRRNILNEQIDDESNQSNDENTEGEDK